MKNFLILLIVIFFIVLPTVYADQERHIHLNGQHLEYQSILELDQLIGRQVEDGYYWINAQTAEWGYEGNDQVQGIVQSIANYNQQQNNNNNSSSEGYSDYEQSAAGYNDWEGVSGTGSVTSGRVGDQNCTYVSVGGTTMRDCD
ncbi:MAG: hypothetical protein OQL19_21055 [Gammaproteobacteria bacterium]|nr:hypothetical protein [Gammaproteobacteria bacterium]